MDDTYLITGRGNGKSLTQLKVMLDKAQGIDIISPDYWNNNWLSEIKVDGYDFSATNVVNKEADKMIFNFGDRVRITNKKSFYYNWVGTVNKIINKSQLYVRFDSGKRSWFNGNHDVELFCRCCEKESDMNKFYVGDRVEVIKSDHKYYGRIGVVDDVIDICGHYTIYVKFCGYCTPWVTESFEPDDIVRVSIRDSFYGLYGTGCNYENFWSKGAYHLYCGTKYEPNVVYTISTGANIDSLKKTIEDYWKRDEQVVKDAIKNLMEENNMSSLPRSSGRYPWNDGNNIPQIKKVIFNYPATIVLFEDGTKSVVKIDKDDTVWDPEHGLAMALVKRVYGTNKSHSNYYDIFKKWLPNKDKGEMFQFITEGSLVQVNNPCVDCPDRKTGCLTNCKKMQDYADECYNKTKKIEDDRVKEIEKKFGEKVRAMRENNKPEEVKKGFIGDFYFKKDYMAQMSPIEFLTFCRENRLMFYLENCETAIDPDACSWQQIFSYLKKGKLSATTKIKYVCNAQFRGDKLIDAVDVNYVVFSKKQ